MGLLLPRSRLGEIHRRERALSIADFRLPNANSEVRTQVLGPIGRSLKFQGYGIGDSSNRQSAIGNRQCLNSPFAILTSAANAFSFVSISMFQSKMEKLKTTHAFARPSPQSTTPSNMARG